MRGPTVLRAALPCLIVMVFASVIAGCGGSVGRTSKSAEPSATDIERSEEASDKQQEADELSKDRELLSSIESTKEEEAAEQKAKKVEALATARAKKKLDATVKKVKEQEKAAEAKVKSAEAKLKVLEANAKKLEEASKAAEAKAKQEATLKAKEAETTPPG